MELTMNKFFYFISIISLSLQLNASSITFDMQHQEAQSGKTVREVKNLMLSDAMFEESCVSSIGMHKTAFVLKLSNLIKSSLTEYQASQNRHYKPYPEPYDYHMARPCPMPNPIPGPSYWEQLRKEHSLALLNNLKTLQSKETSSFESDADIKEAILLVTKLADNMLKGEFGPVFHEVAEYQMARPVMADCQMKAMTAPASLNVTAGGVQDYSHFKKQLQDGFVPAAEAFIEEGFLSSFNLGLQVDTTDQLISLTPAYAYDKDTRKLLIQLGMSSSVTPESFQRSPLNLCFVIDISGSMAATDNTERSRLEWAKDAVAKSISHLNENDLVSIVLFDSVSQVLLEPTAVSDKTRILDHLTHIYTGNSTNLYSGLYDGFRLVSKAFREDYENRVLLFSDAGFNTGVRDTSTILRLVSDYAAENIGLTAIGVGENFHHDFIHKITMSKGGNALFVHTGADMMKFFKNFSYLVTPVAYNVKLSSELIDLPAKLVKTYGVPMGKDEPIHELINIRTLFFSEEGGAIVLEYDL